LAGVEDFLLALSSALSAGAFPLVNNVGRKSNRVSGGLLGNEARAAGQSRPILQGLDLVIRLAVNKVGRVVGKSVSAHDRIADATRQSQRLQHGCAGRIRKSARIADETEYKNGPIFGHAYHD